MSLASILSIRNWPISAEYGLSSIVYLSLSMIFFFIPTAMVSAELATGWPEKGGVFVWIKEAMGERFGFLAIWLLWLENVVWYPTVLSFITTSLAYAISPHLAKSKWYTFFFVIAIFWTLTHINLKGIKFTGWISSVAVTLGNLIPGALIIGLGFSWLWLKNPSYINFSFSSFKDLSFTADLPLLSGILLSFSGIEMLAVHAKDIENPQKNYSKAIFSSSCIITVLTILGTLAIAIIVPKKEICFLSGGIEALNGFLSAYGLQKGIPLIALCMGIGALGGVNVWISGPCKGLLVGVTSDRFPKFLQKTNASDMPTTLMFLQALFVTCLSFVFIFMPNLSSGFWMLTVLAAQLYIVMYLLMFLSAIILRYRKKEVKRHYRVPGGKKGMWIVSLLGILGCLFTFIVGFIPPTSIEKKNLLFFELFITLGLLFFCSLPLIIFERKNLWNWLKQPPKS